ncbi:MAG: PfkB family carbohydrate kinase, partial [Spirochaetota bacterium]
GLIDEPIASAQRTAVQIAREAGALISYDPNYRPTLWPSEARAREIIQSAYAGCHLAKVSEEELDVATGHGDPDVAMNALLESGVELVVISRGAHGALASNGTYRLEVPSPRVEVVETTGAGDGFVAALLVKLPPTRPARPSWSRGANGWDRSLRSSRTWSATRSSMPRAWARSPARNRGRFPRFPPLPRSTSSDGRGPAALRDRDPDVRPWALLFP